MEAYEAIVSRRSIRKYTGESVSEQEIEKILTAAMAAPSAGNQQPWRFVVVTDRERINAVKETTPYGKMLDEAALALVVCGDVRSLKHPTMWEQDCSAAVQNVLLASHALGLGACWLGYWPKEERTEPLKAVLRLPEGVEPLAVLSIGHPAEEKLRSERYDAAFVHRDRW
ncbi:MAG: nitroreductase family protein [Actinomycetota bacterium]|jgi:nitroreductase|nr:nitroreductase family protein [Actinomycetota bacterium]